MLSSNPYSDADTNTMEELDQLLHSLISECLPDGIVDERPSSHIVDVADEDAIARLRQYAITETPTSITTALAEAKDIFSHRVRMDHSRFFGFIPSPVSPLSVGGELLTALYNVHAGSWYQSSGPSAVEGALISWLASRIGLPASTSGGSFCSGGSMANLTGLMLARDRRLGVANMALGTVYVSDQTHLSISKALRILGLSNAQIRKVRSLADFTMDVVDLRSQISADRTDGLVPFAVVASCGTTNVGAIDPLASLADIADSEGLWLHVDGAYGASVALSSSHAHLVEGLGRAHSVSWDAHKWLFQTYGCGMILVRDRRHLYESMAIDADYVRDAVGSEEEPNFWNLGLELTRPARAMKLWFTLRILGTERMGRMIDRGFRLAEVVEEGLVGLGEWRVLSPAQMAIVVFRYEPEGFNRDALNGLNTLISRKMIEENRGGVLTTKVSGLVALRICAISPELSDSGMREVVQALRSVAKLVSDAARR